MTCRMNGEPKLYRYSDVSELKSFRSGWSFRMTVGSWTSLNEPECRSSGSAMKMSLPVKKTKTILSQMKKNASEMTKNVSAYWKTCSVKNWSFRYW